MSNQLNRREVIGVIGMTGSGKSSWTRYRIKDELRLFIFDPLKDADVEYFTSQELLELYDSEYFKYPKPFRVGIANPDDLGIMVAISYLSTRNFLAIEECAIAFESTRVLDPWWREQIFLGRHPGVTLLLVAQRPVSIPIAARSQFSRIVSFRHFEQADTDWLKSNFGRRVNEFPDLKDLECLDSQSGQIYRYRVPYFPVRKKDVEKQEDLLHKV